MGKIFTISSLFLLACFFSNAQRLPNKHNPEVDANLNPNQNAVIHPDHNSSINPKLNWNINPYKNGLINPGKVTAINPKTNTSINPLENQEMNPMFSVYMSPKSEAWSGQYVFDSSSRLTGYISKYNQDIMIQFDKDANWIFFYIRTAKGTFNQFNLNAEWTGDFLVFDSMYGYNLFDKDAVWTGTHIK